MTEPTPRWEARATTCLYDEATTSTEIWTCLDEGIREVTGLREELADTDALNGRLSALLSRIAVALKGEEPPLVMHSWHDLPDLARALRLQVAAINKETV